MGKRLEHIQRFLHTNMWSADPAALPRRRRVLIYALQMFHALYRRAGQGDLVLHAMSLVYTTLLSLVPLLAVSFSVLKAFDVHNQVQPALDQVLQPLGERGAQISQRLVAFVENVKAGVLGSLGLLFLFYTVLSLLEKVEAAFNSIWHNTKPRTALRRFTDYLSLLMVGPVLVFTGLGLTASMTSTAFVQNLISHEPFGTLYYFLGVLGPYVLIIGAFHFAYVFVPNTKVSQKAAFVGAVIAGVLWKTVGWAFATFIANSTNYNAIYSSFAILITFMIWIYLSWLILLLGGQISFYVQNPQYLRYSTDQPAISISNRERLAFAIMQEAGLRFHVGRPAADIVVLSELFDVPTPFVKEVADLLIRAGLLLETDSEGSMLLPARDLETIPLPAILDAVRHGPGGSGALPPLEATGSLGEIFTTLDSAGKGALGERTLRDLIVEGK